MKPLDFAHMQEATRLTRAGQLREATALLRRMLAPLVRSEPAAGAPHSGQLLHSALPPDDREETAPDATPAPEPKLLNSMGQMLRTRGPGARLPGLPGEGLEPSLTAPSAGRFLSGTYSDAAGSLSYKLYVPGRAGEGPAPLVVMLHGCTQSADDFAAGTRMNFAAESKGCFVVYPEQPQAANVSKCWNWFRASDQTRDSGEPALIAGITRQIMKAYDIDSDRVYVAGLSAGGAAAAIMGEAYPDLYAAVGVHSGLPCHAAHDMPSAFSAMRGHDAGRGHHAGRAGMHPVPTIVFHGDQDATVHPSNGNKVIARANGDARLQAAAAQKTTATGHHYTHTVQLDPEGRSILELWELRGMGHAWSGGSPAGSFTSPDGPDATQEMLRFFLEHRRRKD